MTDELPPLTRVIVEMQRTLGAVESTVRQFDEKLDIISGELQTKLPAQPFLRLMIAILVVLSAWLSALTGLTYGRKASNMIFNVRERGAALDDEYMTNLSEEEMNKHVTPGVRNPGTYDGRSKRDPPGG